MTNHNPYIIEREETRYDVRKLTADQLEELELLLMGDMGRMRDQMAQAQVRRHRTGEYANADWWRRVRKARDAAALYLEIVQRARKKRREEAFREAAGAFPGYFMAAAREVLSPDTFNVVMGQASQMQAAETAAAGGES